MISPTRIAEITALAEAATPGPWYTLDPPWLPSGANTSILAESPDPHVARFICDFDLWTLDEESDKVSERPDADAAFIAAARTAVPELLAEREAMVARMAELEGVAERKQKDDFTHGYLIAVSHIMHQHGEDVIAEDCLAELGVTEGVIKRLELDDFDAKPLRKLFRSISSARKYRREWPPARQP